MVIAAFDKETTRDVRAGRYVRVAHAHERTSRRLRERVPRTRGRERRIARGDSSRVNRTSDVRLSAPRDLFRRLDRW